jgi:polysaccharide export outer membrane protein
MVSPAWHARRQSNRLPAHAGALLIALLAAQLAWPGAAMAGRQPPQPAQPATLPSTPSTEPEAPAQPTQPSPLPEQPSPQPRQPIPGSTPGAALADAVAPVDPATVASFYRLQPSDVIDVKYTYTPEYNATVMVRPDGYVTLPVVGEVAVARLTVREVKDAIVTQASQRLRDPELTVELKDFQKPRFVVGGDVGKPGQFELRGRVTVLEAVAMAGGFKTSAKHSQVLLFRRFDQERAVTRIVDAKALTRPGSSMEDPLLLPGDFLFVPQNRISKVERFIPIQTIGWLLNIVL